MSSGTWVLNYSESTGRIWPIIRCCLSIPNSVASIKKAAFMHCESLTDIAIPDSVKSIEESAFKACSSLKSMLIPKGRSIAGYSQEDIDYFADIINGLPRKILGYKTPDELFDRELDLIYADFGTA